MAFNRRDHDDMGRPSFIGSLFSPFRAVKDWFGDALAGDDSFRPEGENPFVEAILFPFKLVWGFLVFMVQAWTTSRNGIAFLRGLPAFSVMAFSPILVWGLSNYDRQISLGPTLGYHQMHLRNAAFENSILFSQKLVELRPESKEFKYMYAEDLARNGEIEQATQIMNYLAGSTEIDPMPVESADPVVDGSDEVELVDQKVEVDDELEESESPEDERLGKAHVWLAQQLIREQRIDGWNVETNEKALKHLRAAIAADPEDILAKANLVDLYMVRVKDLGDEGKEDSDEYRDTLQNARDALIGLTNYPSFTRLEQVMAMPQLVDVCVKLEDKLGAQRALTLATSRVTRIARMNSEIYQIWYALVQSAVALKDYKRANEFIREGYQTVKTQETRQRIQQLASVVYMQKADDYKDISEEDNFRQRLYALCEAILTNPRDVLIYERLVDYIDVDQGGETRDVWMRNAILDCPIPGIVHILIGTRELIRGDIVAGKTSWDIAQHQFGSTEFVTHRLLSVAIKKNEKFGKSDLIDTALELFPDQYMLHETNGVIKKKAGLYDQAIAEFQIVLEKVPELVTVHKHLKDCYEKTGNLEKSEFHRQKVVEILDKLDAEKRERYEKVLNKL